MLLFWGLLVCTAVFLASLGGCGGGGSSAGSPPPPPPTQKIQHVVVIFQENRTPDNLFHDPILIQRGADIQNYGVNSKGQKITLMPTSLITDYDPGHGHGSFVKMYDNGKMDGADKVDVTCNPGAKGCPPPNPQFMYVDNSTGLVDPYFQLAEQYTFGDRMFQTNQGPSFPAHQYIISGTSAPSVGSDLFVADNPLGGANPFEHAGCIAPPEETVMLIDPSGVESQKMYPCFDHPTLTDMLNTAN